MTPLTVALIGLVVMLAVMFLNMPVGFTLCLVGFLGISYLEGFDIGLKMIGLAAYSSLDNYTLSCVPLFILMGLFAFRSGVVSELFSTAVKWAGHLPGGLAISTVLGCGGFAAICGSSTASAASMGVIAYPEMRKYGYPKTLASGCIAAGGTLASMIPPSVGLVIIGYLTETSVGKLLIAGIIPGLLQMVTYAGMVYLVARFRKGWAPPITSTPWKERFVSLKKIWVVLVIFLVVIGGIYAGIMTPTEAASIGAFATFILFIMRRGLDWRGLSQVVIDTAVTAASILIILVGALVFNYFLALTRVPVQLSAMLEALHLGPYGTLMVFCVLYLILGMGMDTLAIKVLTLPLLFPIMMSFGFNPIWFGILTERLIEVAFISPPVGLNDFVLKGVVPELSLGDIYKGVTPFLIVDVINITLLICFPAITLFLPSLMMR